MGRTGGTLMILGFGFFWWVTASVGGPYAVAVLVPGLVVGVALALLAVVHLRRQAATAAPDRPPVDATVGRRFRIVVAVEVVAIVVLAFLAGRSGHPDLIPGLIALVVGLHFFPLARLFAAPHYHVVGAPICACALVGLVAALLGQDVLAYRVPGFGAAVTLWLGVLWNVFRLHRPAGSRTSYPAS